MTKLLVEAIDAKYEEWIKQEQQPSGSASGSGHHRQDQDRQETVRRDPQKDTGNSAAENLRNKSRAKAKKRKA